MNRDVPRFNVHTADWTPLAKYGGQHAILHRSDDLRRVAGTYRVSGTFDVLNAFEEFVYVIAGTVKITVEGGNSFVAAAGDAFYLLAGMRVTWEMSDDFHDLTVLMSDQPIDR